MVDLIFTAIREATNPLLAEPIALLCLAVFVIWAGIFDIRTLKISHRFNKVFLLTGMVFMGIGFIGVMPDAVPSLSVGWTNLGGMLAGFLILFVPAYIKNHPMGGDIKMTAILGFWLGFEPMMMVLIVGVALNALYWIGAFSVWKEYGRNTLMPFAPFFALGVLIVYGIGTCI